MIVPDKTIVTSNGRELSPRMPRVETGVERPCERATCAKPFSPTRPTQRFCSTACRNRSLNDRYRARRAAAGGDR